LAKSALGAAVALGTITAGQAQAYVVDVGGVQYDVTTFSGSYNSNIGNFALPANGGVMPWWGSQSLANEFALAVGDNLGYPQLNQLFCTPDECGPLFATSFTAAFGVPPDDFAATVFATSIRTNVQPVPLTDRVVVTSEQAVWAQAQEIIPPAAPVPGPLPALGAAAAFGASRQLRKRINASKGDSSRATTL
jgi:hypothetical protein